MLQYVDLLHGKYTPIVCETHIYMSPLTHIYLDALTKIVSILLIHYIVQLHDIQFTHVPHSLLGVFLVNVLVHMYLLIGGVGVHWYCIRSKTGAGIDCSRVLPEI